MSPSLAPGHLIVVGIFSALIFFSFWSRARRRRRARELFASDASFAPGGERALARALGRLAMERIRLSGAAAKELNELLRKQRPKLFRLLETYWELVKKNADTEESSPAEEAGSELFSSAVELYADDPAFRRDVAGRLTAETTELVWFDILLAVTCSDSFNADGDAFDIAFEAYVELPEEGQVGQSLDVASMLVEWAHEAERLPKMRSLRQRYQRCLDLAAAEEREGWQTLLADLDANELQ